MPRWFMVFILLLLVFGIGAAMPPHPQNLLKIDKGEIVAPPYMRDPGYARSIGINKAPKEPILHGVMSLANFNLLVVLVQFSDQAGVTAGTMFDSLIFGQTFHRGPSLKQYYNRVSYGSLTVVTVNLPSSNGWFTLPHNKAYYTVNGGTNSYGMGTYPNNSQGLCEDMLNLIDPYINLSNYDNNADDTVDGIIIVHSGRGSELSSNIYDIWSHKWQITPQYRDGVYVKYYCVDPEYRYTPNDLTVGVFAHEFGHILGLPDLYDYGGYGGNSYGLGYWSLMAYGSWNGNLGGTDTLAGSSPAFPDAYCRVKLGFSTVVNIPCYTHDVWVWNAEDSSKVYRLWTYGNLSSQQYFLVENRDWRFTDTSLAAPGLLIYHVDEAMSDSGKDCQWWPEQPAAYHYMVALEQGDNAYHLEHLTNGMDLNDPYRAGFNNNFSNTTNPSSRDYNNSNTQVILNNINTYGQSMLVLYMDVDTTTAPAMPIIYGPDDGYAYNQVYFGCNWYYTDCASKYHVQLDDNFDLSSPFGQDSTIAYNYWGYSLSGRPDGDYYWRMRAGNAAGWSGWTPIRRYMLDRKVPWGTIASSPDTTTTSSFWVTWNVAQDSAPSSGISGYDLWCDSGSGWYNIFSDRDTLSYLFNGAHNGMRYFFKARARDRAFNLETDGWTPECTTYTNIAAPPCSYMPGDINSDGLRIGGDVTYGVRYFKGTGPQPPDSCYMDSTSSYLYVAGDVNGNCEFRGSDITRLVSFFKGTTTISYCHFFPPPALRKNSNPPIARE
ncbi:MAG: M6 family metalloprotease domain-containing protein [candidate division Zixibacteria bacterium]|nr:M6 family metalloprotease domain-containing protein [candidate division Zixibacteria bacterium]